MGRAAEAALVIRTLRRWRTPMRGVLPLRRSVPVSGRWHWIRLIARLGLVICSSVCIAHRAGAQQQLPGTVQPGQIERRFQPPPAPRSTLRPIVPPLPQQRLAPNEAQKIHFVLSRLEISSSTVYSGADLLPLYKSYLGKEISVADLYAIADALTVKYRNDGYILSRAYVPRQSIENGVARIDIIEGYVDNVRIQGNTSGRPELFRSYIEKIEASRPLQLDVLERYLLLAGDLAGTTVRSVFEPSTQHRGAATLIVTLTTIPFEVQGEFDNRGTKSLGPLQLNLYGALYDLMGLYERNAFNFVVTPQDAANLQYYYYQHEETIDSEGTKLTADAAYVRENPGDILAPLDVQGRDLVVRFRLSHPFIRLREHNLFAGFTFRYEDSTTDELGARAADDRIRSIAADASYDFTDAWRGITQFGGEITHGLPILGATPETNPIPTRIGGTSDFTKIDLHASRQQELPDRWSVVLQATAQYSTNRLLASEQFAYGGEPFGRAYDPSEITGDSGAAGSLELRYAPKIPVSLLRTSQLFAFYDVGEVFNRIHPSAPAYSSGASAGFGLRIDPTPFFSGSLEVDKPLTRIVAANNNKDWRVFFRIVGRY
jgi:hemolysin activation/secretion protein